MAGELMKCGHSANAVTADNKPCCAICIGINPGAEVVNDAAPSLDGRTAKCSYCPTTRPSEYRLPFFTHTPGKAMDSYYCGCRGWE